MKNEERIIPIIPLDEVLKAMSDNDEIVRMAAKSYYSQYYMDKNRLQNERPSK